MIRADTRSATIFSAAIVEQRWDADPRSVYLDAVDVRRARETLSALKLTASPSTAVLLESFSTVTAITSVPSGSANVVLQQALQLQVARK